MMAKYRCNTKTFVAPELLPEGTVFVIDDSFIPGPHLDPLDEAAEKAMASYYEAHPGARLNPIEDIPMTTGFSIVDVAAEAQAGSEENPLSLADASGAKAKPGPTEAK